MVSKSQQFELAASSTILSAGLFLGQQGLANWGLALVGLVLLGISVVGRLAQRRTLRSEPKSTQPSAPALQVERLHAN